MARDPERELAQIDNEIERAQNQIKAVRTDSDDAFFERSAAHLRREIDAAKKRVETLTSDLARIEHNHAEAPALIEAAHDRIFTLRARRTDVDRQVKMIKQLKAMGRAVKRIEGQQREDARRAARKGGKQ